MDKVVETEGLARASPIRRRHKRKQAGRTGGGGEGANGAHGPGDLWLACDAMLMQGSMVVDRVACGRMCGVRVSVCRVWGVYVWADLPVRVRASRGGSQTMGRWLLPRPMHRPHRAREATKRK